MSLTLDRYPSYQAYIDAKARIYRNARSEIINRDEPSAPQITREGTLSFGADAPSTEDEFGLVVEQGVTWLARGEQKLIEANSLSISGRQNWLNALAAMAIVSQFGVEISPEVLEAMRAFPGLEHRCEQIADKDGIRWINDSKGTNVGATMAAISGIEQPKILVMGGQAKGADFSPLRNVVENSVRQVILIGEDAEQIEEAIADLVTIAHADTLEQAVVIARDNAEAGDVVMLSPACASFDMFENYRARGDAFRELVNEHVLGCCAQGDEQ